MGWMLASAPLLPFFIASCVLGGFALGGWRRTGATAALLIAIAAGLRALHEIIAVYNMWRLWGGHEPRASYLGWMAAIGVVQFVGSLISELLFIVGVALLLRRLPARAL